MAVTVSGILRDSGGNPSPNDVIKFYTVQGFNGALPSATLEVVTSETGSYDFELSVGIHILSVQYDRILTRVGKVTVTSETPSPQTLDTLLALGEPLLPDEIIAVKQLVAEANAAAQSVSEDANKVAQDKDEVAQNTQTVSEKTQIVEAARAEVESNTAIASQSASEVASSVTDNQLIQQDINNKAQQVSGDADQVAQDKQVVANNAQAVATNTQTVSEKAQQVSDDADQVAQDKLAVANNTRTVLDAQSDVTEKAQQVATNTETVNEKTQTVLDAQADVTEKANQVASDAQQVSSDKQTVLDAKSDVTEKANQVASDAQQVSLDAAQVAQDKQVVEAARSEVESNTTIASDAAVTATAQATIATNAASKIGDVTGGMVVNRLDANGNQNVMYKIPMFTNKIVNDVLGTNWLPEEDVHPAFKRADNTVMPWFEVGMYIASNDGNGNPVSAPHKQPYHTIDFDDSKAKCQSMGSGWGLMTNAQWSAIAIWCLMNEYQPTGNTYYGQSHDKKFQTSIRQDGLLVGDASGTAQNLTGTGPKEWNHNNSAIGIADLVGNVWEWVDGLKIQDGQIIVAENSDPEELNWVSQAAYLDDGLKLNTERTDTTSTSTAWSSLGKSETYTANQLLQQLMIEPITETGDALGRLYYNNDGERLPFRGGRWSYTSNAGVAALSLGADRTSRSAIRGFRPAYFE